MKENPLRRRKEGDLYIYNTKVHIFESSRFNDRAQHRVLKNTHALTASAANNGNNGQAAWATRVVHEHVRGQFVVGRRQFCCGPLAIRARAPAGFGEAKRKSQQFADLNAFGPNDLVIAVPPRRFGNVELKAGRAMQAKPKRALVAQGQRARALRKPRFSQRVLDRRPVHRTRARQLRAAAALDGAIRVSPQKVGRDDAPHVHRFVCFSFCGFCVFLKKPLKKKPTQRPRMR
jgi:hypothetical protein